MWVEVLFWLYLGAAAFWDIKTRTVPRTLLLMGGLLGFSVRLAALAAGRSGTAELCSRYLPGFLLGAVLLAAARFSPESVGTGDGLCLLSCAFWTGWETLFLLLLGAMTLCALGGSLILRCRKMSLKTGLPFLPFLWAAESVRLFAALIGQV